MNSEFVAEYSAYKGEDTKVDTQNVLAEVTEVTGAKVEIAFTAPDKVRHYLRISLPELIKHSMPEEK